MILYYSALHYIINMLYYAILNVHTSLSLSIYIYIYIIHMYLFTFTYTYTPYTHTCTRHPYHARAQRSWRSASGAVKKGETRLD